MRAKNIYGYVYSPFRVNDFIESTIHLEKYDVAFQIFDGLKATPESRIYASHDVPLDEAGETLFGSRETLYLAGRPWTLVFNNSPLFERSQIYARLSYGILLLGFFISGLLFFAVHSITGSRKKAVLYAQKVNKKLIRNVSQLEQTQEQLKKTLTEVEIQKDKFSEANIRLKLATKSAQIGVWEWDIVRDKIFWDSQMYALYGLRRSDFSGAYEAWIS